MAERSKAHAWKACIPFTGYRGFESLSLRTMKIMNLFQQNPAIMTTKKSLSPIVAILFLLFVLPATPAAAQGESAQGSEMENAEEANDTAQEAEQDTGAMAQDTSAAEQDTSATSMEASGDDGGEGSTTEETTMHQLVKQKFIEGDPRFMAFVLICLIVGLALSIERIIYLNLSTTNTEKLLNRVETALANGGVEEAKKVCRETKGPIASIFYQGLDRSEEGIEVVEKSVISYGGVQMGLLEKGLSWIQLFIAIAPMLGFMGTVFGMISAFDSIAAENNISPQIVASGIQQALITTVSGLMVGILLQVFYNYIVSKVDGMVNEMESASISLVDLLVKHEVTTRKNQ